MNPKEPSLHEALAARGYGSKAIVGNNAGRRMIFELASGKEVGAFDVVEAWAWLENGAIPYHHHAPRYSAAAVDAAIASSNRAGRKISGREAKLIHRLLKGRHES